MCRYFVLCLLVAISVEESFAASIRNRRQVIPREFQNINIENYLKNERAVRFQLKCIVDDGPCDRIGKYLKVTIPELLVNQCANCDTAQRERAGKLVSHIQQHFPEEWERAVKKFQGGLVKPEDAAKLENLLGIKLDPKLVGASSTTPAPVDSSPIAKAVEISSTSEVPISSSVTPVLSSSTSPSTSSAAPATTVSARVGSLKSSSSAVSESVGLGTVINTSSEPSAVISTSEALTSTTSTAPSTSSSSTAATSI